MNKRKLVVLGASGFVGTTLTERLLPSAGWEVVPVINSAGSAWRLARLDIPLVQVDITNREALKAVLQGATHVVNCTRGGRDIMLGGLRNVLAECRAAGVQRFVHLSSVMVYGDPPHPESHHEDAPAVPIPGPDSYGMLKFEQDQMVQQAVEDGLPSVVLCPPNISGPFSQYLVGIVNALRSGSFAMMDEGAFPISLVDVRTLSHAIELALDASAEAADGRRIFVTDGAPTTWRELVAELAELAERGPPQDVRRISRTELERLAQPAAPARKPSVLGALRHLVSSDVREALRRDPVLAKVDGFARGTVAKMGTSVESTLRRRIEGAVRVPRPDPYADLQVRLCLQQLRGVCHMNDRAGQLLRFAPLVDFERSMSDFRAWYRSMYGFGSPEWPLFRHLYAA